MRSRRYRDLAALDVLLRAGTSVLVIELQGALFFGSAERLAQIVDRETAERTTVLLLKMRRVTEIDSTGARILGELDAALKIRGVKLALILSGRTETASAPRRYHPGRLLLSRHRPRDRMGRGRTARQREAAPSEASFAVLCREQPDIAIKLLRALGRELSVRIRYANLTIQQLEK